MDLKSGQFLIDPSDHIDSVLRNANRQWNILSAGQLCVDEDGILVSFNDKSHYSTSVLSIQTFLDFLGSKGLVKQATLKEPSLSFGLVFKKSVDINRPQQKAPGAAELATKLSEKDLTLARQFIEKEKARSFIHGGSKDIQHDPQLGEALEKIDAFLNSDRSQSFMEKLTSLKSGEVLKEETDEIQFEANWKTDDFVELKAIIKVSRKPGMKVMSEKTGVVMSFLFQRISKPKVFDASKIIEEHAASNVEKAQDAFLAHLEAEDALYVLRPMVKNVTLENYLILAEDFKAPPTPASTPRGAFLPESPREEAPGGNSLIIDDRERTKAILREFFLQKPNEELGKLRPLKQGYNLEIEGIIFKRIGHLGRGSFGDVIHYIAKFNLDEKPVDFDFAIKWPLVDTIEARNEIEILQDISESKPGLVLPILGLIETTTGPALIMPLAKPLSRKNHLRGEDDLKVIISDAEQLVDTLGEFEQIGIVHRDVKPDNLLRDDAGRVIMTDFGTSTRIIDFIEQNDFTPKGTPLTIDSACLSYAETILKSVRESLASKTLTEEMRVKAGEEAVEKVQRALSSGDQYGNLVSVLIRYLGLNPYQRMVNSYLNIDDPIFRPHYQMYMTSSSDHSFHKFLDFLIRKSSSEEEDPAFKTKIQLLIDCGFFDLIRAASNDKIEKRPSPTEIRKSLEKIKSKIQTQAQIFTFPTIHYAQSLLLAA